LKPDNFPSSYSHAFAVSTIATPGDGEAALPVHYIDQAIYDIANEFKFTIQEVKEFFEMCSEMDHTRKQFHQMQQLLKSVEDSLGDEPSDL